MYDFHIHSILSDGVLIPAEICQQYLQKGFKAIAITDHCDFSNIKFVVDSICRFIDSLPKDFPLKVFSGVELTHLPVEAIGDMVSLAKQMGVDIVIVHGETMVEPVPKGTNRAAIEAGCDILAHPGFISEEDARLAAKKGVFLEVTTRGGHCYTNGWVVSIAKKVGAKLIVNNDMHAPSDIFSYDQMMQVLRGTGLDSSFIAKVEDDIKSFYQSLISSRL